MSIQARPLNEITQQAVAQEGDGGSGGGALLEPIHHRVRPDYTEEREALYKGVTLDQILAAMKKP